jgi:chemotaxis protein CheX
VTIPDAERLNPFIVGAFAVLESFGIHAARRGELSLESTDRTTDPVTVIIPIVGDLEGAVFYGLTGEAAERLAGTMLGDLKAVRFNDELVESALGEFGNVVTGQAAAQLEAQGLRCNIAPPIVALQSRLILSGHPFDRLVVPIETPIGQINIRLAVREKPNRGS